MSYISTVPLDVRSLSLSVLMILAFGVAFYVDRAVRMPIVLALLLSFLLVPAVKGLTRLRLPEPLGAAVVLLSILSLAALGSYALWQPATEWGQQLSKSIGRVEAKLRSVKQSVEDLKDATQQVEDVTQMGATPFNLR